MVDIYTETVSLWVSEEIVPFGAANSQLWSLYSKLCLPFGEFSGICSLVGSPSMVHPAALGWPMAGPMGHYPHLMMRNRALPHSGPTDEPALHLPIFVSCSPVSK